MYLAQLIYKTAFLAFFTLLSELLFAQQGIFFHSNPYPDRYFFAPTGFGLKQGERVYQNTLLGINQISFGKQNGKMYSLGMIPTFVTGNAEYVPIWLTCSKRFELKNPRITPYIGANFLKLPKDARADAWMFYSGVTFGTPQTNINTGFFVAGWGKDNPPVYGFMLHRLGRVNRTVWVVSENYLVKYRQKIVPISLLGLRKVRKKIALEVGIGWYKAPNFSKNENQSVRSKYGVFPWLSVQKKLIRLPRIEEE
jgi:hypothetical protein